MERQTQSSNFVHTYQHTLNRAQLCFFPSS